LSIFTKQYLIAYSDLSRFIANGRLACTIDKVSGVITTTKTSAENKTVAYEQVVKQGDILLNGKLTKSLGRETPTVADFPSLKQIFRS